VGENDRCAVVKMSEITPTSQSFGGKSKGGLKSMQMLALSHRDVCIGRNKIKLPLVTTMRYFLIPSRKPCLKYEL
jgi:hypothetical protein